MKGELHAMLERSFADLVEIAREDPGVRRAEVLRSEPAAQVRLQRLDAEIRAELRVGGVAVERRLQLRRVEVVAAAGDRRDADAGFVEHLLEDRGGLLQIQLELVPPRLDSVESEPGGHLDAFFGVRLHRREHVAAHGPPELVGGQGGSSRGGDNDTQTGPDELAAIQHEHLALRGVNLSFVCLEFFTRVPASQEVSSCKTRTLLDTMPPEVSRGSERDGPTERDAPPHRASCLTE